VKRAIVVVAAAALLGGACARGDIAPKVATRLENQVSWIRRAAEAGAPRIALSRLETLTATVQQLLDRGRIDHDRALDILSAAGDVRTQLALLPIGSGTRSSSAVTPSPSPTDEQGHGKDGEGNGGNGHGNDED
jgi:hypothetical protein